MHSMSFTKVCMRLAKIRCRPYWRWYLFFLRKASCRVTAIGEVAPDKFVKRSTAQKGDLLCVSGDLGAAYLDWPLTGTWETDLPGKSAVAAWPGRPDLHHRASVKKAEARKDIIDFLEQQEGSTLPPWWMWVTDLVLRYWHIFTNKGNLGVVLLRRRYRSQMKHVRWHWSSARLLQLPHWVGRRGLWTTVCNETGRLAINRFIRADQCDRIYDRYQWRRAHIY